MARLGTVSERAPVGDGPRGLQRRRGRLVLLHPRAGALAGLPVGRGRPGRDQRRQAAAVPGAGAVERAGPDPQGAAVRPDQRRGQPRRGRQGVLLLRRQRPDPQLPALPVQVPAGRVSLQRPGRGQPGTVAPGVRVRADRHRHLRRRELLRRRGGAREGVPRGHLLPRHRAQPLGRGGRAAGAADAVVPQHLVLGRRGAEAADRPGRRAVPGRPGRRSPARRLLPVRRPGGGPALLRQRDEHRARVRRRADHPLPQGRHRRPRHRVAPTPSIPTPRAPRPPRASGCRCRAAARLRCWSG